MDKDPEVSPVGLHEAAPETVVDSPRDHEIHPQPPPHRQDASTSEPNPAVKPEPPDSIQQPKMDPVSLQDLYKRFHEVESKMSVVGTMYDLHESVKEAAQYSDFDRQNAVFWNSQSGGPQWHLDFLRDSMFFMRKIRHSYQTLQSFDTTAKTRAEETERRKRTPESETMRQVSTNAFLSHRPAKMIQLDWLDFLLARDLGDEAKENFVLAPIEIISCDPEPQTVMQLESSFPKIREKKRSPIEVLDESVPSEGEETLPLPERIKIHSRQLVAIFLQCFKDKGMRTSQRDGSVVFMRPYQELVYHEGQLRAWLANLEASFENYDGTESSTLDPTETRQDAIKLKPDTEANSDKTPADGPSGAPPIAAVAGNKVGDTTGAVDGTAGDDSEDAENGQAKLSRSITALLHLRCLIGFIDKRIKPKQEYIGSARCSHVHFHDLWFLFKPGDEVVDQEERQVYVVLRVQPPQHKSESEWERHQRLFLQDSSSSSDSEDDNEETSGDENPFTLHCVHIDFDGKAFGPIQKKFRISSYGDRKSIRSLPVYPFRLAKDPHARKRLIERGKLLLNVAKFKSMYYMGVSLDRRHEIDSQVVIDFKEALSDEKRRKAWEPKIAPINAAPENRRGRNYCIALCCADDCTRPVVVTDTNMTDDYIQSLLHDSSLRMKPQSLILSPRSLEDTLSVAQDLTETELLVMTYRVFGFVLRSRKWAQLDLGLVRYEHSNRSQTVNAFKELVLPAGHKEIVKSLVVQHFRSRQSALERDEQTDLVQGKGKGLILLLHGEPGVGKTTTAEGISELFRKPLFQITCGDLGTTAKEVEVELEQNFALASRWGCILLLDEADVFLASRQRQDFKRNGLVAVFLRILEYYTGVLFLTTNRIGDFDEAFASRIHMSLYYPALDEQKTLKVFELNLRLIEQRLRSQGRSITFDSSSIENFAREHFRKNPYHRWNGRQIRNACQTALALAEFDAQGDIDARGDVDAQEVNQNAIVNLQLKYFLTVQTAYVDFAKYIGEIHGEQGDPRAFENQLRSKLNTPFQPSKPSRISQKQEARFPAGPHGNSQHLHAHKSSSDMSQSAFGAPPGPYHQQPYRPTTPSGNMPQQQGYGQFVQSNLPPPQAYQGPVGDAGRYENTTPFAQQPGSSQQGQTGTFYEQQRQQSQQCETPPPRFAPAHVGEASQRAHLTPGQDGPALASRPAFQSHQPQYAYSGGMGQEGSFQDPGPSMRENVNVPRFAFQHGQDGSGGRDSLSPYGGNTDVRSG